jgi:selenocysteine lyase/cysteine desulfurase
MLKMDMHDLGVDYYAASPHKWLDAPTGTGLLYMRRESQDRVWPTIASTGWDDPERGAGRFDRLSQRAWPLVLAVGAAVDFQQAIGRERIEQRVRALQARLRSAVERMPGARMITSASPDLSGALLAFSLAPLHNADIVETLKRRHGVWIRTVEYGLNGVRASTHIFNSEAEVDRLLEGLDDCVRNGVIKAPTPAAGDAE